MKKWIVLGALLLSPGLYAGQNCSNSAYAPSAPSERFEDNGDGTVTDHMTTLMWMRCAAGQVWSCGACAGAPDGKSHDEATAFAERVNTAGDYFFNDWQVPSLTELASIAELQCTDPRIDLAVFPDTPADFFWSRSIRASGTGADPLRYALSFGAEGVGFMPPDESNYVRLVRYAP
jgi:hypothetical protein